MPLRALTFLAVAASAGAAVSDPAALPVETLQDSLLKSMQADQAVSMMQRYRTLEPVIEKVFALPLVTRLAVGPDWATFSPDQQKAAIAAFTRLTIANYAHNFRDFDGQKFEIDDNVVPPGPSQCLKPKLEPQRRSTQLGLQDTHASIL